MVFLGGHFFLTALQKAAIIKIFIFENLIAFTAKNTPKSIQSFLIQ